MDRRLDVGYDVYRYLGSSEAFGHLRTMEAWLWRITAASSACKNLFSRDKGVLLRFEVMIINDIKQ